MELAETVMLTCLLVQQAPNDASLAFRQAWPVWEEKYACKVIKLDRQRLHPRLNECLTCFQVDQGVCIVPCCCMSASGQPGHWCAHSLLPPLIECCSSALLRNR